MFSTGDGPSADDHMGVSVVVSGLIFFHSIAGFRFAIGSFFGDWILFFIWFCKDIGDADVPSLMCKCRSDPFFMHGCKVPSMLEIVSEWGPKSKT